ncbi:MAG: hypothetical protein H8D23_13925 [Candidatus Brocadiales bacterium]|nr:hypothetical protein [Candidatus Brocadiales bacterium]
MKIGPKRFNFRQVLILKRSQGCPQATGDMPPTVPGAYPPEVRHEPVRKNISGSVTVAPLKHLL